MSLSLESGMPRLVWMWSKPSSSLLDCYLAPLLAGDDVRGFENVGGDMGGLAVTGNYLGRAGRPKNFGDQMASR